MSTNENSTQVGTLSPVEAHVAGRRKERDNSNTTSLSRIARRGKSSRKVWGTRATTPKNKVIVLPNETTFSRSDNYSDLVIETEGNYSSNCTMILPKNHPPLTHQADAIDLISQWKYFEDKVQPRLPNETTAPQELRNTVTTLRNYIIRNSLPRWSIDSDYFRKAGVLTGLFPQSKMGIPVNFLFYSCNSSITPITLQNDAKSLQAVSLGPDSKLQVICHDFGQGASERWVKQLKDAILKEGKDNHVLVVGWRQAASRNYWTAVANSRPVGRKLACLLRRLRDERGLRLRSVHLVGLGLGAHVARYAAVSVIHKLCERVGRVTGLDVSAPLFEEFGETLNAAVAEYVDLIHTSADFVGGLRGQIAATGHVDYYTSGVFSPKSCILSRKDFRRDCDHAQSAELFVKSVRDGCGYRSTSCELWSTVDTCSGCGPRGCGHMGFRSPSANGTGPQFLPMRVPTLYCEDKPVVAR
ncbi:phospholipase A1-like [Dermacentor silvarum]|uniref:phospholipase A1-like n=1 Tax=Dermacentor silvarum TaxID=543639 RepID=UPI002101C907|nr:phospholipase A1-like [Dermacentor silvarum]